MRITFESGRVVGRSVLDAERVRLAPFLWPVRAFCLFASAGALLVAYYGSASLVPIFASWLYGQDVQAWPNIAVNFLEAMQVVVFYVVAFGVIALALLRACYFVANTYFFDQYWQLTALDYSEKEEALRLAERWPSVEAYRRAVASQRDFLRGDLAVMRTLDEKAQEEAHQEQVNQRLHQTDIQLRQGHSGEGK